MIGWMSRTATSSPFQRPQARPTQRDAKITTGSGYPLVTSVAATAPQMAMTAPMERSMPRVAITSVMPMASSATGAPRTSTSMRLP